MDTVGAASFSVGAYTYIPLYGLLLHTYRVELGYNVTKGCVVITEECNVKVISEELIGTT